MFVEKYCLSKVFKDLEVGKKRSQWLGAQSFSKNIPFQFWPNLPTLLFLLFSKTPTSLKSLSSFYFFFWSSYLVGNWTFINNTDDHLNGALVLSNCALSTNIQSFRKARPMNQTLLAYVRVSNYKAVTILLLPTNEFSSTQCCSLPALTSPFK